MDFTISLGEGLYNSGVLGFYRVIDDNDISYELLDNSGNVTSNESNAVAIRFNSDIFDKFTDAYLSSLINNLGKDAKFHDLEDVLNELKNFDPLQKNAKEILKKDTKLVKDKMTTNSYKAAYEIIAEQGETYDFNEAVNKIKKANDSEIIPLMIEALEKMCLYKNIFILKDLIYSKVQYFWSGVSFLHKQENKTDFKKSYEEYFIEPIKKYCEACNSTKKRKPINECCHCQNELTSAESYSMSWINNTGVDIKRKTSSYWDFNVDIVLCPVCAVVYSCIPLGFATKGSESYFVNMNSNLGALKSVNNFDDSDLQELNYYTVLRKFIINYQQENAKNEIDNIQVLRRSEDSLYQNILSKDKLKVIKECSKELEQLSNIKYLKEKNWYNLFDETINCIFSYQNMYRLFNDLLSIACNDSRPISSMCIKAKQNSSWKFKNYLTALELIQIKLFDKGDFKMNEELMDIGFKAGFFLRKKMLGPDRNENKIKSLSFKLINALKGKNINLFLDTVMRQYLSEGDNMPKEFTTAMKSEETFLVYGYAFVNGLNSYIKTDNENKEENDNE